MSIPETSPPCHQQLLKDLHAELEGEGLLAPSRHWIWKLAFWVPVFLASYGGLMVVPFGPWWFLLVPASAMAMLTMGYLGHDAGHYALSRRRWINAFWGHFTMSLMCGINFVNWRTMHNRHHVHCQEVEGDPDMQFGLLFSVYPNSPSWRKPLGRLFLRIQKWLFWPLSSLHWLSMRTDAVRALIQQPKETRIDRFVLPLHVILWLVLPGLVFGWGHAIAAYLAMSCLSSLMTASVFTPNHIGMRRIASHEKVSYLEQQITTSRNIGNPAVLDFYYGGLNSQIEHHLFPRVAHNRYRAMRPFVKAFCEKRGFKYQQTGLFEALASVSRHLRDMTAAFVTTR